VTVFLSTHSLHVAEELADSLAIIHKGELLIRGSLEHIRDATGSGEDALEDIFLELTSAHVSQ
jgi:ABC-2 type transport system ATP-binding protein